MKKISFLILLLTIAIGVHAQRLEVSAPSQVSVGEQFRLTYTVNTQNVSGFHAGNIPDALEVLMGPCTSSQSSFQMVNGHTNSSSSITYTYILCANKNGSFVIPPAHVSVGGRNVASSAIRVRVSGKSRANANASSSNDDSQPTMRAAGSHIGSNDLFIKVNANKTRVHEQEPILLTYKVYTQVDLTQLEGKMPDLKGFHTQEIPLPQQKNFRVERINGRAYRTVTWSQYVMYPQMTGKLQIPSIKFNGVVVQQNRSVDPFEAFFNGGSGYVEVRKSIIAPGVSIQVDPLPTRPSGFSGGVGHFNISAQLNNKEVKANDPITLRVVVSGIGNLKLIKQPVVNFPKDFDKYDAKITDKTSLTANGVEGNMVYDFLAVPRHQGEFTIPAVEFTYYDTNTNSYKTIKTHSYSLKVTKGSGSGSMNDYSGGEDVKMLNSDIRYIKTGDANLHDATDFFFGSTMYMVVLAVLLIIFVTLLIVFRHRAIENANIGKIRGKKANKMATRRLKLARQLMFAGKQNEFYDEILKALWGYVGDKLNIPVEQLSKDNISDKLQASGVSTDNVSTFIDAINDCEFERYAPGDTSGNMERVFGKAMEAIELIDGSLGRHRSHKSTVVKSVIIITLLSVTMGANAITKANADTAYVHENYQQAIKDYEELLHTGVSSELYYNLGNSYYRTDNITKAVLNYERALLLSPGDPDIRFNLQLARSKTIDKITPESEMFFITWYHSLVNITSVDGWAYVCIVSLVFALVLALLYLFSSKMWIRKTGFFGGMFLLFCFILCNVFAYQQQQQLIHRTGAIITAPSVTVKGTPSNAGTDLFVLHEGTKVIISDGSMKGWKEIRLADGKEGWIQTSKMEEI